MVRIHPSAVVDSQASLGENVEIGPFCVVEGGVQLGDDCQLASHVVVRGNTSIGAGSLLCDGAVVGNRPQHTRLSGPVGGVQIGRHNVLREHVTIHAAMAPGHHTVLGDGNYLMAGSHVAHDCHLGNQIIMANHALLAGHVHVADAAFISGAAAVHQYCRIGACAMVGGQAHITQDILPYVTVDGKSSQVVGLNVVGLRRQGFTAEQLRQLKEAYRIVFRSGNTADQTRQQLLTHCSEGPAAIWLDFIAKCKRGYVRERSVPTAAVLRLYQPDTPDAAADGAAHDAGLRRVA